MTLSLLCIVGHVGYPQARAHNMYFVGNVGHYLKYYPYCPQLALFWKRSGDGFTKCGSCGQFGQTF